MSLNMQHHQNFDQTMWNNPWMQQQSWNPMMPMMPGGMFISQLTFYLHSRNYENSFAFLGMPSRSRNHSRAASPALSLRSRRSLMSSRSRQKYMPQDLTDDEDSDIDNFTDESRSRMRKQESRSRQKHLDLDHRETEVINRIQKMKEKSKYIRERRSGSLTNWPTTKSRDSGSLTPSDDEANRISTKFRKASLTSLPQQQQQKLLSDSASERDFPVKHKPKEIKKKSESELESDPSAPAAPAPNKAEVVESVTRPLKIINGPSTSNAAPSLAKEEQSKKVVEEIVQQQKDPIAVAVVEAIVTEWECQHCTFVNEADAKICTICCKTRVDVLQQLPKEPDIDDIDINQINDSIQQPSEGEGGDGKQGGKGKARKISFLPGTKAH